MDRLQKKCFASSVALHGLLGAILLVAPAFLSKRQPESPPALTFIPRTVLDSALSGGGSPTGAPPPPPVKVEQPLPTPPSPPPTPVTKVEPAPPPAPKPPPELPKPVVKNAVLPIPAPKETRKQPTKPVEADAKNRKQSSKTTPENSRQFNFDKVKTKPSDIKRSTDRKKAVATEEHDAAETAAAQARAKALAGLKGSLNSLQNNLSSPISAEPLGPGGAAFANYGQIVVSIYQNAWVIPDDLNDDGTVVQATVTIARDGTVVSARILNRSGRSVVDKSVQRTLDTVKFIQRFPEGARDAQRTFNINFNLKAKRQLG